LPNKELKLTTTPTVDVCMMGARNLEQMRENLKTLDQRPMTEEKLQRMRRIGEYIHR
jgi:aryl-alcohol dehydrogenase-like predicted oxidoreductase